MAVLAEPLAALFGELDVALAGGAESTDLVLGRGFGEECLEYHGDRG